METTQIREVRNAANVHQGNLLTGLPVKEYQLTAAGIATTWLEGGEGSPLVLLHGPGESSVWWMRVIPHLIDKYKVIMPDLPGHGSSASPGQKFSSEILMEWLDDFLRQTCEKPPVLVGHILGGAIAARYAAKFERKLEQLVLVNTLGLSSFRPALRFVFEMFRFMNRPDEKSYSRFLTQCTYDLDGLTAGMGETWQPFMNYNLDAIRNPEKKSALKKMMNIMSGKIPGRELQKIRIPVKLIWGRYDKATRLKVAVDAGKKYGWPLRVIEDTRDDPKLERPEEFVQALLASIGESAQVQMV